MKTSYRKHIENMVRFSDKKKGIVRNIKSMENAIDERIRKIKETKAVMDGLYDYDDSRTEY
jgi:low affinity Fe/Cu permease